MRGITWIVIREYGRIVRIWGVSVRISFAIMSVAALALFALALTLLNRGTGIRD